MRIDQAGTEHRLRRGTIKRRDRARRLHRAASFFDALAAHGRAQRIRHRARRTHINRARPRTTTSSSPRPPPIASAAERQLDVDTIAIRSHTRLIGGSSPGRRGVSPGYPATPRPRRPPSGIDAESSLGRPGALPSACAGESRSKKNATSLPPPARCFGRCPLRGHRFDGEGRRERRDAAERGERTPSAQRRGRGCSHSRWDGAGGARGRGASRVASGRGCRTRRRGRSRRGRRCT